MKFLKVFWKKKKKKERKRDVGVQCTINGTVHRRLPHFTLSPLSPSGTFPHGFFIFPFFPPLFLVSTAIHTFVPLSFLVPFTLSTSLPHPLLLLFMPPLSPPLLRRGTSSLRVPFLCVSLISFSLSVYSRSLSPPQV